MSAPQIQTHLPRDPIAPYVARRSIEQWFGPLVAVSELETIKLLTSELVTNAVIHGTGEIILRGRLYGERVLVEVIDEGHGFGPTPGQRDLGGLGGRGLAIVDSESKRWGTHEGATHVWFEVELQSRVTAPGPAQY